MTATAILHASAGAEGFKPQRTRRTVRFADQVVVLGPRAAAAACAARAAADAGQLRARDTGARADGLRSRLSSLMEAGCSEAQYVQQQKQQQQRDYLQRPAPVPAAQQQQGSGSSCSGSACSGSADDDMDAQVGAGMDSLFACMDSLCACWHA